MDERFYPQEPPDSPVDKPEKEYEPDTQCPELNGTCTGEQHPGVHTSPVYFWENIKPIVCDCGCLEGKLSERLAIQKDLSFIPWNFDTITKEDKE
jgi:hypothetical protein